MRKLALSVAAAAMLSVSAASANPVDYNGGLFDVTAIGSGGSAGAWYYDFKFTADLANWVSGTNDEFIGAINFGVSGVVPTITPVLQSTNAGAVDDWEEFQANATGNGCTGGNNFEACIQVKAGKEDIAPTDSFNGIYEWVVRMTYANKLTVAQVTDDGNPIRAWFLNYCDEDDNGCTEGEYKNAGLMSLNTPFNTDGGGGFDGGGQDGSSPEPATLALLGLALTMGAAQMRRRNRK